MAKGFVVLLAVLALAGSCLGATYWFGTDGTQTNPSLCTSATRPATPSGYCSYYSPTGTLPTSASTVMFNDTLTSWPEITLPGTPGLSLTVSTDYNQYTPVVITPVLLVNSPQSALVLDNVTISRTTFALQTTVASLTIQNCNWENAIQVVFNSYDYTPTAFPITMTNIKATFFSSNILLEFENEISDLQITSSTFNCVEDPAQPGYTCGAMVRYTPVIEMDSVLFSNVNMTGGDNYTSYDYSLPWIALNTTQFTMTNCYMTHMVLTPLTLYAHDILITDSTFRRSETATTFGCSTKCSEGYGGYIYDEESGLFMTVYASVLRTLSLKNNVYYWVSSYIDYETNLSYLAASVNTFVQSNTFENSAITVSCKDPANPAILDNNAFNRHNQTFPSIIGTYSMYFNYTNGITEEDHAFSGQACNVFFINASISGVLDADFLCLSGTVNLTSFVTTIYMVVAGVPDVATLNVGDTTYFSVYSEVLIHQVHVNVLAAGTLNIEKSDFVGLLSVPEPSKVSMYPDSEIFLNLQPGIAGVYVNRTIGISTGESVWEFVSGWDTDWDALSLIGFRGHYDNDNTTTGFGLALVVDSTFCPCSHGGTCYERYTSCNCTGLYAGPFCDCSTQGLPAAASCATTGGKKWVIEADWDLYASQTLTIPTGYTFVIAGNCTNKGTIVIGANTTMTTTGAFTNHGKLVFSTALSKVDLGGGQCVISSSSALGTGSYAFSSNSSVDIDLDASGLPADSGCIIQTRDFFKRAGMDSLDSLSSTTGTAPLGASNSSQLDGKWNVTVRTTPSTTTNVQITRSPPGSVTSASLSVETHLSEGSCGTTSTANGLLSLAIAPCDASTPSGSSSSKKQVKWWWYGIPIIVVAVIVLIVLVVVLAVPSFGKTVLPYRGTRM